MTSQIETLETAGPATIPSRDEIVSSLAACRDHLAERVRATEDAREVPKENVELLREKGLFKIVQPAEFGGWELDFETLARAIQELAKACPSTAWVCGLQAAHQYLVASFPAEAQRDVWGADPDALICGSYAPATMAEAVEGGYRISGSWAFASGCDVSTWSACAAMIPQGEGKPPKPAFLLVPQGDWTVDDDWFTVGLAGTGSKSLVLDNVFVPAHRLLYFDATTSGDTPGSHHHADSPVFRLPMLASIASCLASVGIGSAAGALEAFVNMATGRTTRGAVAGGQHRMVEFPTVQIKVAEAEAAVDAAREILLRDLRNRAEVAQTGRIATVEERIESRRGQAFAVKLALQAADTLNAATGGQGLALDNPIQLFWRDCNAVARHITFNWDAVASMCGQQLLGLEPKGQY